jgi:DNA repair protein RecO (recombination protein O)
VLSRPFSCFVTRHSFLTMDERTSGLILRTRPLTETSLIVQWLTPDLGRVATVAKGARRPKSPFRGKLDLFYEADFSFARSKKSDLHNLREVVLGDTHGTLRENLGWLQQASYLTALVEQTTETETPLPKVYHLVRDTIALLCAAPPTPRTVLAFEFKLLEELGLSPDVTDSSLSAGSRHLAQTLTRGEWSLIGRLKLSEAQARELRQFLHGFMIYHLERIPPSRTAALNAE